MTKSVQTASKTLILPYLYVLMMFHRRGNTLPPSSHQPILVKWEHSLPQVPNGPSLTGFCWMGWATNTQISQQDHHRDWSRTNALEGNQSKPKRVSRKWTVSLQCGKWNGHEQLMDTDLGSDLEVRVRHHLNISKIHMIWRDKLTVFYYTCHIITLTRKSEILGSSRPESGSDKRSAC